MNKIKKNWFACIFLYVFIFSGMAGAEEVWHDWFAVDLTETPMVGDFNGDGMTDIITFTRDNPYAVGDVYVALSDGTKFGENTKWHDWFAINHDETVVIGDFDGDGVDDIATWLCTTTRQVYVALSYGTGMDPETVWLSSIGVDDPTGTWNYSTSNDWTDCYGETASSDTGTITITGSTVSLVLDGVTHPGSISGSGSNYVITVSFPDDGGITTVTIYITLSSATTASGYTIWTWTDGIESCGGGNDISCTKQESDLQGDLLFSGNFDGDAYDDLILFARNQGKVYVALSTGIGFSEPEIWHNFFAVSTYERPRVGDLDGDGCDDIITFATDSPTAQGDVYTAISTGSQFGDANNSNKWHDWFSVEPSQIIRIGDLDWDGRDDFFTFMPPPSGQVYTVLSGGTYMADNVLSYEDVASSDTDLPFVGDVDGDGKADIIIFCQGEGKAKVVLTQ